MLVVSRRPGQDLIIGKDIRVTIRRIAGQRVRLSIAAPGNVRLLRGELLDEQSKSNLDLLYGTGRTPPRAERGPGGARQQREDGADAG